LATDSYAIAAAQSNVGMCGYEEREIEREREREIAYIWPQLSLKGAEPQGDEWVQKANWKEQQLTKLASCDISVLQGGE
jgi:hypothetical protein